MNVKKYATSMGCLALTALICFVVMHLMSLASVEEWVGAVAGSVIFVTMLIITLVYRKIFAVRVAAIIINAVGDGLAVSSLFVHLGAYPEIWESAVVFAGLLVAFLLYALPTAIKMLRERPIIFMGLYICLILAGLICGAVLTESKICILALMGMIPFTAFLITTAVKADGLKKHIGNMAYASFAALILVILVVVTVLSEGETLDGLAGVDSGKSKKSKRAAKREMINPEQ